MRLSRTTQSQNGPEAEAREGWCNDHDDARHCFDEQIGSPVHIDLLVPCKSRVTSWENEGGAGCLAVHGLSLLYPERKTDREHLSYISPLCIFTSDFFLLLTGHGCWFRMYARMHDGVLKYLCIYLVFYGCLFTWTDWISASSMW